MNRDIKIYTELDSLFDSRRGILSNIIAESNNIPSDMPEKTNQLWDTYIDKNYKARKLDTFEYIVGPLRINRDVYKERFNRRSIADWTYYYPSSLAARMRKIILDLELTEERPFEIRSITLLVNTFPYTLDDELNKELIKTLQGKLGGAVKVKTLTFDVSNLTLEYYRSFDYVFKYDILTSESNKAFQESIGKVLAPELKLIVPDILVKDDEMFVGSVSDRIYALGVVMGPSVTIVPVNHEVYDYTL